MADAQRGRAHLVEPGADQDAVVVAHVRDDGGGIDPRGCLEARHRIREERVMREHLHPHRVEASAEGPTRRGMAAEAMVEPLLEDEAGGDTEGVGEVGRNRDRLAAGRAVGNMAAARHRDPVFLPAQEVIGPRARLVLPALHGIPRRRAHGHDGHAERGGEALLGAGHVEVHAPLVGPDVDAREGRDGVEHEERPVPLDHAGDVRGGVGRPGRGLVVDHGHDLGADPGDLLVEAVEVEGLSPLDGELRHLGPDADHDLAHERAEHTRHDDEHPIARLDHRDGGGLERGAARARHDDDLTPRRLEDLAQVERDRLEDLRVEVQVVLDRRRLVHRLDDRPRQLGGPGDHENGTALGHAPTDGRIHDHTPFEGTVTRLGGTEGFDRLFTTASGCVTGSPFDRESPRIIARSCPRDRYFRQRPHAGRR